MDDHHVSHLDAGKAALDGKLVVVLAQAPHHVIDMVQNGVLLAQHRDMVVGAVHRRAHQVGGAGVQAHVLPVDVLQVEDRRDQVAVGGQHKPAQLRKDGHVSHAGALENPGVLLADPLADDGDVALGLLGPIVHTDAAGEVDEGNVGPGGIAQAHSQLEELPGKLRVILVGGGVGGQEGVDAEVLHAQLHQAVDGPGHLVLGHAVFRVPGHIHNGVAQAEGAAGVIPQAHRLRQVSSGEPLQKLHVGGVVQVNVGPHLQGLFHILLRGDVGGEHDVMAGDPNGLGQQQLRIAGAVAATALLLEDLDDIGVGGSLHGKILPEALVPGEGRLQCPGVAADARLVVNMEGRRNLGGNLFSLFLGDKGYLFHGFSSHSAKNPGIGRGVSGPIFRRPGHTPASPPPWSMKKLYPREGYLSTFFPLYRR